MTNAIMLNGGDGLEWHRVTLTQQYTNDFDLFMAIIGGSALNQKTYIVRYVGDDATYNRIRSYIIESANGGVCYGWARRYRNGNWQTILVNPDYDAFTQIGDVYEWAILSEIY